jgi:hypothetical protein
MLQSICPKLPYRDRQATLIYYVDLLSFEVKGEYPEYILLQKDQVEIHFFEYATLDTLTNYGQVYVRCKHIQEYYRNLVTAGVVIHPHGQLATKPWGQIEFSLLDPDNNLITFGESC